MRRECYVGVGKPSNDGLELDIETILVCFISRFLEIPCHSLTFVENNDASFKLKNVPYLQEFIVSNDKYLNFRPLPFARDAKLNINFVGLCTVLRYMVKSKEEFIYLLGEHQKCFKGCAEISKWTDLCENKLLRTVKDCILKAEDNRISEEVSNIFNQLEKELSVPPIVSNVNKRRRDSKKQMADLNVDLLKIHPYFGGLDFLLLDLVITCYLCIMLQVNYDYYSNFSEKYPKLFAWFSRMIERDDVKSTIFDIFGKVPEISPGSLDLIYVSDNLPIDLNPKVEKPPKRVSDHVIEEVISKLSNRNFSPLHNNVAQFMNLKLNFSSECLSEIREILPGKRFARKCEQLENMIVPVYALASKWSESCKIVDFCCGSGYLGVTLSKILPNCKIILIENKEESLSRIFPVLEQRNAEKSSQNVALQEDKKEYKNESNVEVYQCNLEHFQEKFDIGVCLHGCGLVTDLVLQKCFKNKAAFVICPCCYGAIKNIDSLSYPKSSHLKVILDSKDFTILAHGADHSEEGTKYYPKAKQCMTFIDSDRLLEAQFHGYTTWLFTMNPSSCTPKNNLLIGIHPDNPIDPKDLFDACVVESNLTMEI